MRRVTAGWGWSRAVAGVPVGGELEPAWSLLGHRHLHHLAVAGPEMDVVTFRHEVFGIAEQIGTVLDDPAGSGFAAGLLVRRRKEDDIPRKRLSAPVER